MDERTVPDSISGRDESASVPRMTEMSWISWVVSLEEVDLERSCESLARRQGCFDMWTFVGREEEDGLILSVVCCCGCSWEVLEWFLMREMV